MSEELMNTDSRVSKIKRFFVEQFWLILLFAPLLAIVLLVGKQYLPSGQSSAVSDSRSQSVADAVSGSKSRSITNAAMQITTAELTTIIAKPMSELLLVEVYFGTTGKVLNHTAELNAEPDQHVTSVILIPEYDEMLGALVSTQVVTKEANKKREAFLGV